jgi:hypothetical protein
VRDPDTRRPVMDKKKTAKTEKTEALAKIDQLEITPLSDEELDSVAGGYTDSNTTAESCSCCSSGATVVVQDA